MSKRAVMRRLVDVIPLIAGVAAVITWRHGLGSGGFIQPFILAGLAGAGAADLGIKLADRVFGSKPLTGECALCDAPATVVFAAERRGGRETRQSCDRHTTAAAAYVHRYAQIHKEIEDSL